MTAPLVRLGQGDFIHDIHPHDLRPLSRPTMPATAPRIKQIVRGRVPAPRRTLVYGTPGIGKSTFASMADRPVFVSTEDGLSNIDCERFPLCTRYRDVLEQLESLHSDEHDYRTIAIDSLDWLERLIWAEVCAEHGVKNIEEIGYAKGYAFALTYWREVLAGLDALRHDRGMDVILVAHARIERFENPETDPYDRFVPRPDPQGRRGVRPAEAPRARHRRASDSHHRAPVPYREEPPRSPRRDPPRLPRLRLARARRAGGGRYAHRSRVIAPPISTPQPTTQGTHESWQR